MILGASALMDEQPTLFLTSGTDCSVMESDEIFLKTY